MWLTAEKIAQALDSDSYLRSEELDNVERIRGAILELAFTDAIEIAGRLGLLIGPRVCEFGYSNSLEISLWLANTEEVPQHSRLSLDVIVTVTPVASTRDYPSPTFQVEVARRPRKQDTVPEVERVLLVRAEHELALWEALGGVVHAPWRALQTAQIDTLAVNVIPELDRRSS